MNNEYSIQLSCGECEYYIDKRCAFAHSHGGCNFLRESSHECDIEYHIWVDGFNEDEDK